MFLQRGQHDMMILKRRIIIWRTSAGSHDASLLGRVFRSRARRKPSLEKRPCRERVRHETFRPGQFDPCVLDDVWRDPWRRQGSVLKILFRDGNLTLALAGCRRRLWAGSGCGGSGRAPGWCGWAVSSLLRRCCGGAVCWRPAISLPTQSVIIGEVGSCVGVRWRAGGGVGVLRTGPVAAGVRVYSSVSHL